MSVEYAKRADITVSNRQRKYFDEMKLVELAEDIEKNDLLHAIAIRDDGQLVAGERRLRAMDILHRQGRNFRYNGLPVPVGYIPVVGVSERDDLGYREAELSENLAREDLSWQERTAAVAALHQLRTEQNQTQSIRDTASELKGRLAHGGEVTEVSEDISLAQHLHDEDVVKAKTKGEAIKILRAKKLQEKNRELAEKFRLNPTAGRHQLVHGDAIEVLTTLPESIVDVVVTDPPYGIGADTHGDQQFLAHEYDDSLERWFYLMRELALRLDKVCKAQAHAYVFCDIRNFQHLVGNFNMPGWSVWPTPLIWDKGNMGLLPRPEHGPRRCYEAILYAIKGNKPTTGVYHDVIRVPGMGKQRYAAEKPVDLYVDLLKRSVHPGDTILDPFAGSGPILPAANRLSCRAIAIELTDVGIGICSQRLEEK